MESFHLWFVWGWLIGVWSFLSSPGLYTRCGVSEWTPLEDLNWSGSSFYGVKSVMVHLPQASKHWMKLSSSDELSYPNWPADCISSVFYFPYCCLPHHMLDKLIHQNAEGGWNFLLTRLILADLSLSPFPSWGMFALIQLKEIWFGWSS